MNDSGELSVLEIEPKDPIKSVLAVLNQHRRPVIITLPTNNPGRIHFVHPCQLSAC